MNTGKPNVRMTNPSMIVDLVVGLAVLGVFALLTVGVMVFYGHDLSVRT